MRPYNEGSALRAAAATGIPTASVLAGLSPARKMEEIVGRVSALDHAAGGAGSLRRRFLGKALHSSTYQLNLSASYDLGGARRGCVARVKGVLRVCRVFLSVRNGSS